MHHCIISLAANCNQEENLAEARCRLGKILFSPSYTEAIWTEPFVSKKGNHSSPLDLQLLATEGTQDLSPHTNLYLNQLVYAETELGVGELEAELKAIELSMGRTTKDRHLGIVRIDLDLLQYDSTRYHLRDWERPYIRQLLR